MFDYVLLLLIVMFVWSILTVATLGLITVLEFMYCKCKPSYGFSDYVPTNIVAIAFWPILFPLLLVELVYITTYCAVIKLRNYL